MDLEFANSRTEVPALGEGLESWTRGIETPERQFVTTPIDFDTIPLEDKEDGQGRKGNGAREGGGGDAKGKTIQTRLTRTFESDTH
jgi:hypothetical protein